LKKHGLDKLDGLQKIVDPLADPRNKIETPKK